MKKVFILIAGLLLVVFIGMLVTTMRITNKQADYAVIDKAPLPSGALQRFTDALAIKTISSRDGNFDKDEFDRFNQFLFAAYPQVFSSTGHEVVNQYSHIIKWRGTDPSLEPIILMAHLDVVPIANPGAWSVDPFSEGVKNGVIYGRGAIDNKLGLIGIMEAVNSLIAEGFAPQRTTYLVFGHDEEVLGLNGAKVMAQQLAEKNVKAHFILDEGLPIADRLIPGIDQQVAMIGIAEKGFLSLELQVEYAGGHSSVPAPDNAISILSSAVLKVKAQPFKADLNPVIQAFMDEVAPKMGFWTRFAMANRWLLSPLIIKSYESSASGNASLRTTIAPTIFQAGVQDNVIPSKARAVINFRIIPGQTIAEIINHVVEVIDDDRVVVQALELEEQEPPWFEASAISSMDSAGYEIIKRSIAEVFADTLVAPGLLVGATDSRHLAELNESAVYRFLPYVLNDENLNSVHGVDERVTVDGFANAINFYRQVIINANQ